MRIGNTYTPNFKGRFYLTTDSHTRLPILAGTLSEIDNRAKIYKEPQFYIDGGDFVGVTYPNKKVFELFNQFHKNHPRIPMIFNMGNAEILSVLWKGSKAEDTLKKLSEIGAKLISLTMINELKQKNIHQNYLLPYTVIEDEHNGEKEKIMVTGLYESKMEDIKNLLKNDFLPAYKKEKPDKVLMLMHMMTKDTNDILDYAKELGIENISLVIGGHPHSLEDYTKNGTRVLYPPAHGKGAFVVDNLPDRIKFDKLKRNPNNGYDYSPLKENPSVIKNTDIFNPLPINEDYQKILFDFSTEYLRKKIVEAPFSLKYRNDYDFAISEPTELGTFLANAYRDQTGADIGLVLSMDLRETAPPKKHDVTYYNICDMLNFDKPLYKYESIDADTLKKFLEISLKRQEDGIPNKNFLEYSDNIKVARYINAKEDEPKIAQIYIKKNGEFVPLLDENQKQLSDEKFSVTTCEFVAHSEKSRPELSLFKQYPSKKVGDLTGRKVLIEEYIKYAYMGITEFKAAEMENIIKE